MFLGSPNGSFKLEPSTEAHPSALFRKHSHSTRVEVKLGDSGGQVWMRVKDFGVGFDSTARANGIGLAAMRERLRMVGGSLRVKSSPGVGTELTAEAKAMTPATSSHAA